MIDRGRIIIDEQTDAVRDRAANIVGDAAAVDAFVAGREVIHRESLGRVASVTVLGSLTAGRSGRGSPTPVSTSLRSRCSSSSSAPPSTSTASFAAHPLEPTTDRLRPTKEALR